MYELVITFSAGLVSGTPLEHPREPKWSPDIPQETAGPLTHRGKWEYMEIHEHIFTD